MDDDRNLGVTEARFALTLLICVLVAVGYVVLLRLSGSGESTMEIRPEVVPQSPFVRESDNQPKVLPIDPSDRSPEIAKRPGNSGSGTSQANPNLPAGLPDPQRR